LLGWIHEHGVSEQALPVYITWLNNGGDKLLIRDSMLACLQSQLNEKRAVNLYLAWLRNGGDEEAIRGAVLEWILRNWQTSHSLWLVKFYTDQVAPALEILQFIIELCRTQPAEPNSLYALALLGKHLSRLPREDVLPVVEAVLLPLIRHSDPLIKTAIIGTSTLLIDLITASATWPFEYRERVGDLLLAWLRNPASFGSTISLDVSFQRVEIVEEVLNLSRSGKLSHEADAASLERFVEWVVTWEQERKSGLPSEFRLEAIPKTVED
jgi:hypothetical protein